MDAYTRLRLEIEGYLELEMWDDAQTLLEEFSDRVVNHPEVLGFLAMLGVAIEFVGHTSADRPKPALVPVLPALALAHA